MQYGQGSTANEAVTQIAELFAKAYRRYAELRLLRPAPEALPSTEALANTAEPSVHELTLTGQKGHRKE